MNLTTLARVLIKIATLVKISPSDNESDIETYIRRNQPQMRGFLASISQKKKRGEFDPIPVDLDQELCFIVQYLESNLEKKLARNYLKNTNNNRERYEMILLKLDEMAEKLDSRESVLPKLQEALEKNEDVNINFELKIKKRKSDDLRLSTSRHLKSR